MGAYEKGGMMKNKFVRFKLHFASWGSGTDACEREWAAIFQIYFLYMFTIELSNIFIYIVSLKISVKLNKYFQKFTTKTYLSPEN